LGFIGSGRLAQKDEAGAGYCQRVFWNKDSMRAVATKKMSSCKCLNRSLVGFWQTVLHEQGKNFHCFVWSLLEKSGVVGRFTIRLRGMKDRARLLLWDYV
jgi:hypothetical protein